MTEISPLSLEKNENRELVIRWSDDILQIVKIRSLRENCPCATCMEKNMAPKEAPKGELKILSPAETMPLDIVSMRPVGNYAYNIEFSDGHTSGLFTLELLRKL